MLRESEHEQYPRIQPDRSSVGGMAAGTVTSDGDHALPCRASFQSWVSRQRYSLDDPRRKFTPELGDAPGTSRRILQRSSMYELAERELSLIQGGMGVTDKCPVPVEDECFPLPPIGSI